MATLLTSYSESNKDSFQLLNQNPTSNACAECAGETFVGDGKVLTSVKFYLNKYGSVTGNVYAILTTAANKNSVLATSTGIAASSLVSSPSGQLYEFTFPTPPTLTNGTSYFVGALYQVSLAGGSDGVYVGYDNSSPSYAGGSGFLHQLDDGAGQSNAWVALGDVCFYVYTDIVATAASQTESGSAADTPSATATFEVSEAESGTAADSPSAGAIVRAASQTEAGSASETSSVTVGPLGVGAESGSLSDTPSAVSTRSASQIDAGAVVDAPVGHNQFSGVYVVTVKVAPFFSTDVITQVGYRIYKGTAGALTADGAHTTTGINSVPNVTNGYSVSVTSSMVTVDPDGGYRGAIVWDTGGASPTYVLDEIYIAPTALDLTQVVPTSNAAGSVGDALNAARADGFGKWMQSGTTLNLYAADGVTVVRTFTLDSATAPTQRV